MPRPATPMDAQHNARWNAMSDLRLLYIIISLISPRIAPDFEAVAQRLGRTVRACQVRYQYHRRRAEVEAARSRRPSRSPVKVGGKGMHAQKDVEGAEMGAAGKSVEYDDVEVKTEVVVKTEEGEEGWGVEKGWEDEVVVVGERRSGGERTEEDPFGFAEILE